MPTPNKNSNLNKEVLEAVNSVLLKKKPTAPKATPTPTPAPTPAPTPGLGGDEPSQEDIDKFYSGGAEADDGEPSQEDIDRLYGDKDIQERNIPAPYPISNNSQINPFYRSFLLNFGNKDGIRETLRKGGRETAIDPQGNIIYRNTPTTLNPNPGWNELDSSPFSGNFTADVGNDLLDVAPEIALDLGVGLLGARVGGLGGLLAAMPTLFLARSAAEVARKKIGEATGVKSKPKDFEQAANELNGIAAAGAIEAGSAGLFGAPVYKNTVSKAVDDPSIWRILGQPIDTIKKWRSGENAVKRGVTLLNKEGYGLPANEIPETLRGEAENLVEDNTKGLLSHMGRAAVEYTSKKTFDVQRRFMQPLTKGALDVLKKAGVSFYPGKKMATYGDVAKEISTQGKMGDIVAQIGVEAEQAATAAKMKTGQAIREGFRKSETPLDLTPEANIFKEEIERLEYAKAADPTNATHYDDQLQSVISARNSVLGDESTMTVGGRISEIDASLAGTNDKMAFHLDDIARIEKEKADFTAGMTEKLSKAEADLATAKSSIPKIQQETDLAVEKIDEILAPLRRLVDSGYGIGEPAKRLARLEKERAAKIAEAAEKIKELQATDLKLTGKVEGYKQELKAKSAEFDGKLARRTAKYDEASGKASELQGIRGKAETAGQLDSKLAGMSSGAADLMSIQQQKTAALRGAAPEGVEPHTGYIMSAETAFDKLKWLDDKIRWDVDVSGKGAAFNQGRNVLIKVRSNLNDRLRKAAEEVDGKGGTELAKEYQKYLGMEDKVQNLFSSVNAGIVGGKTLFNDSKGHMKKAIDDFDKTFGTDVGSQLQLIDVANHFGGKVGYFNTSGGAGGVVQTSTTGTTAGQALMRPFAELTGNPAAEAALLQMGSAFFSNKVQRGVLKAQRGGYKASKAMGNLGLPLSRIPPILFYGSEYNPARSGFSFEDFKRIFGD